MPPTRPDVDQESKEEIKESHAPLFKVICHDDPFTTMDFVIMIFRSVFRLTRPRAIELMFRVHYTGSAVVGLWPESVAKKKVERATALARAQEYPLTLTIEPE